MAKKTNKTIIEAHLSKLGRKLGSYDTSLNNLTQKALKELLDGIYDGESTDVAIKIRGQYFMVECSTCDNEMDMYIYTRNEYLDKYGEEYEYKFE